MKQLLCLLMLASTSCFATVNQIEFNLGRGTPLSSIQAGGSSDREGARGTEWSADWLHQVGPQVYIGIGGGHFRSDDNVSQTLVPNANSTLTSRVTSILLLSRVDLGAPSRMVPYVIAGMGWVRNSLSVVAVPTGPWPDTGTSEQRTLLENSVNTVGLVTGLGLDYALSDRLFIGLEARYQTALQRTFDLTAVGSSTTGTASVQTSMNIFMLGVKAGIKY